MSSKNFNYFFIFSKFQIVSGINSGALEVSPEKIHAEDQDTLRSTIKYELISGSPPDFANFFQINFQNGVVTQIAPVSRTSAKEYNIIVRATEMPNVGKFAETNLVIKIKAEDLNPPVLTASDTIGKQTAENVNNNKMILIHSSEIRDLHST